MCCSPRFKNFESTRSFFNMYSLRAESVLGPCVPTSTRRGCRAVVELISMVFIYGLIPGIMALQGGTRQVGHCMRVSSSVSWINGSVPAAREVIHEASCMLHSLAHFDFHIMSFNLFFNHFSFGLVV